MKDKELKYVCDVFDIKINAISQYNVPETYDFHAIDDYNSVSNTYIKYKTKPKYDIVVNQEFMDMLNGFVEYLEYERYNLRYNKPNAKVLYHYLTELFEKNRLEQKLNRKYPELDEIKNEYEVMKKLIVDPNDL